MYRATLYRDLCICHTKTRRQEDALKLCTKHTEHDSGSMASKLLYAEALLLNERFEEAMAEYRKVTLTLTLTFEEAMAEYRKVLEMDEHSRPNLHPHPHLNPNPDPNLTARCSRWTSTLARRARGSSRPRSSTSAPRRSTNISCST